MQRRSGVGLLATRRFAPLFVTNVLDAFNDNLFKTALLISASYGIYRADPAAGERLAVLATGVFVLPFFALSALAGQVARGRGAEPGTRYDVVTGAQVWSATVRAAGPERVEFTLETELLADPPLPITLLPAVFKYDRMEWAIEKATELGVERISPLLARRTEKHLAQAAGARVERWRRIAQEAAKQSRRADVPIIDDPQPVRAVLTAEARPGAKILLAESERVVSLSDVLRGEESRSGLSLALGPEGGWTVEAAIHGGPGWLLPQPENAHPHAFPGM